MPAADLTSASLSVGSERATQLASCGINRPPAKFVQLV